MIKVFNGQWRGLGKKEKNLGLLIGFEFREYLHEFKGACLAVFMAIVLHSDENGHSFPSYDLLQKETGYERPTIANAVKNLCEMRIEGHGVLMRYRERDERGHYIGSNHYIVFPTDEELQSSENPTVDDTHSKENPQLDKPNCGESELEVNPSLEVNPLSKEKPSIPTTSALPPEPVGKIITEMEAETIYRNVTGFPSMPSMGRDEAIRIICDLSQCYGSGTTDYIRPYYLQYIKTRGRNGMVYKKTGFGFLDYAATGTMPTDYSAPPVAAPAPARSNAPSAKPQSAAEKRQAAFAAARERYKDNGDSQ